MRSLLRSGTALIALAVVLSGCAQDAPTGGDDPLVNDEDFSQLKATADTGVIRGVVVDAAIRPISGVLVQLTGSAPRNITTADAGTFGFDGLAPGTYFLAVSKAGYVSIQVSAEVVAGQSNPAITKVQLEVDPAAIPYFVTSSWSGYIECSFRVAVPGVTSLGVNACNGVNNQDVNFQLAPFDAVPDLVQGELIWDSTQTFGSGLSFVVGPPDCRDVKYARADGPSTLVIALNGTRLVDASEAAEEDGFSIDAGICYRVFSYVAGESQGTVGLVTAQKFDAYFHGFYNMLPPEGWRFSLDGNPPIPA